MQFCHADIHLNRYQTYDIDKVKVKWYTRECAKLNHKLHIFKPGKVHNNGLANQQRYHTCFSFHIHTIAPKARTRKFSALVSTNGSLKRVTTRRDTIVLIQRKYKVINQNSIVKHYCSHKQCLFSHAFTVAIQVSILLDQLELVLVHNQYLRFNYMCFMFCR